MSGPDQGASAQRTRLAWRRTGLSATAVAVLAVQPTFAPHPGVLAVLIAAAALGGWATLMALTHRRGRGLAARTPRPGARTVIACAAVTVGFAVIGGLVVTL